MRAGTVPVSNAEVTCAGGPYFDELSVGEVFDSAPSITLTAGMAATHQAIIGDRIRLALDANLASAVTGGANALAHPGLVWDVAIGQSTLVTQRVKANLFYRGLAFHRSVEVGDTLSTRTEIVGMKQNSARPGRPPTGLVALRITTMDQAGRLVLDFHRCAMLPLSPGATQTDWNDDLSALGSDTSRPDPTSGWDAAAYRSMVPGNHYDPALAGCCLRSTGDVVSSAPELARLSLNIAATHHDHRSGGRRLVYGGHTIGIALAQATRLIPNMVTVLDWASCDHTAPVHEGDTLYSDLHVENATSLPEGRAGFLDLRSVVYAVGEDDEDDREVLDWRYRVLMF